MNILDTITIKARMVISFILIVALFIIFGLISMNQMRVLGNLTTKLHKHPLRVSNAALKAKAGIISMHRSMKDVSTSATQFAITTAIQTVQSEEKKVYQELDIIKSLILGEEGKLLVSETVELFAGWKPIRLEVEELVLEGNRNTANQITRGKGADYVVRLERKMSELTSYALNKADSFANDAEKVESKLLIQTVLFVVFLIFIILTVGYFMSSSIMSSVASLKDTMMKITETGDLVKADLKGNHEITEMSKHFNTLIDRLKELFWLSDGQNNLNRELSGELTYDQILTRGIESTSRYVNACAGALYIYDENEGVCEIKSSFALAEGKHFSGKFKFGEGVIGQVAIENRSILLKNISSQDAIGKSGTISKPPQCIFALPLFYEEKLYGVLEIASFEEITEIKQQYLKSVAKSISAILHTVSQNEKIKKLLGTSQEANEKLQAQTEELRAQTEELQAMNEEFQQQSDELKEQNHELEAQRQQVEEANRLKSEFLSNMSHELRTPLNSVNALSRVLILQASEKLSGEEVDFLEIIERNGKHLLSLINDILDLSKIEAGRMDINLSHFSIKTLIENIIEGLEPLAHEKNIKLEYQFSENLPGIESDESRVYQIVQNIIANGVKFTHNGSVMISADSDDEQVRINIKDTGIGISDVDLETIFDEFRQVDGASTRKYEGTGLGLAIAFNAAKILGGDITVKSTSGLGSTFSIILPITYAGPKEILDAVDTYTTTPRQKRDLKEEKLILIVDDDPHEKNTMSKILIVEDNEGAVIQVKKALETIGLNVDVARDGVEALEYIQKTIPQGIILDLMMPNIDGFQVLETISGTQKTKNIPVLILTAKDLTKEDLRRLSSNNVRQLIQKGDVDREELLDKVQLMLGNISESFYEKNNEIQKVNHPLTVKRSTPVILVVEDNPDNMTTIKAVIHGNYTIEEAVDGEEGLQKAVALIPDLILLDISLPKIDGLTVVRELKKNKVTKHIPVIALTAQAMKGDKEKIIGSGCDDYASKPIDPESFLIKFKKWLFKCN